VNQTEAFIMFSTFLIANWNQEYSIEKFWQLF